MIRNLALYFCYHVLWPKGLSASSVCTSAAIALNAAVALFRFKQNVIHVIATCAVLGLIAKTVLFWQRKILVIVA